MATFSLYVQHPEIGSAAANNARIMCLVPVWAIHLRAELDDPYGFLPSQNVLWSVTEVKTQDVHLGKDDIN